MARDEDDRAILRPYDPREAVSVRVAARFAGVSEQTIRNQCAKFGIGRRVGGGQYQVSRIAHRMLLEGDHKALRLYLCGDRASERVLGTSSARGSPKTHKFPKISKA